MLLVCVDNRRKPFRDMPRTPSRLPRWTFADLVDFEYLLAQDSAEKKDYAWRRDRTIYRTHLLKRFPEPASADRSALLRSWLRQRRKQPDAGTARGKDVSAAWRTWVSFAVVACFIFGMLHAGGVLYVLDQQGHVNIVKAFALTVLLPWFVTLLAVIALALRKLLIRRFGELPSLRVALATWVLKLAARQAGGEHGRLIDQVLPARRKYSRLVASHVGIAASTCAIAMSLGLATSLTIFHFAADDVRFGWTTTYDLSPPAVSTVVQATAAPWAELMPFAVPSLQQIDQSWLLRERSRATVPAEASRAWAFFLLVAILFYGCVLRLVLFLIAAAMARHALNHVKFQGQRVLDLLDRMSRPLPEEELATVEHVAAPSTGWWGRMWRRVRHSY